MQVCNAFTCANMLICLYLYLYIYIYACVSPYVYLCVCVRVGICVYLCVCVCICVYVYAWAYAFAYVYVYVCIYIYIYTHNVQNYNDAHASMLASIHTCTQIHRCVYPHAGGGSSSDGAGALLDPKCTPMDGRIDASYFLVISSGDP